MMPPGMLDVAPDQIWMSIGVTPSFCTNLEFQQAFLAYLQLPKRLPLCREWRWTVAAAAAQ